MTLLGKILILLNLLASGAFVYFATQDFAGKEGKGGRQAIAAAGLRFKLYLTGLPFDLGPNRDPDKFDTEDETPFIIEMAGSYPTETVSKKILVEYFKSAPPGHELGDKDPVPSQLAEIKRVQAKIKTLLADKGDADKIELLRGWLIDQCETYEQRQQLQTLAKDGKAAELEKRLMDMFESVLAPPAPAAGDAGAKAADGADDKVLEDKTRQVAESRLKPLDPTERQTRATQLLAFLSPDIAWQKRVMIVFGLRRYVAATASQASRYKDMAARLEKLIVTDQKGYLEQDANLNQLARGRTDLANRQSKLYQEKVEEKKKEDDFIALRQTQLRIIQTQLLKVKAEVDELLAKQGRVEAGLFEIQREVAVTLDSVYRLETELAAREKELLKRNAK